MATFPCDGSFCETKSLRQVTSIKGTKTSKVVDSPLTKQEFIDDYLEAMTHAGFEDFQDHFDVNDVAEYYGGEYHCYKLASSSYLHPLGKSVILALTINTSLTHLILSIENFDKKDVDLINDTAAQMGCNIKWQSQSSSSPSPYRYYFFHAGELAKMMRDTNQIELDISHHQLFPGEETILQAAFLNRRAFQSLNLNGVRLGSKLGQSLADYLDGNSNLIKLELQDTRFSIEVMQSILRALFTNTTLTMLDLSNNGLTARVSFDIAQLLKVNTTLTSLNLSNNHLGDEAMKEILIALCSNATVTALDLNKNEPAEDPFDDQVKSQTSAPFDNPDDTPVENSFDDLVEDLFGDFSTDDIFGRTFDDLPFGDPSEDLFDNSFGDPFDDSLFDDPFAPPVHEEPFDMGHPNLTHVQELWTPAHETMSIQMFGPHVDLMALKDFLKDTRFPFMARRSGDTLLHTAAYFGEIEAMKVLIDAGHPVHVADRWSSTPLHSAAETGQAEAVELLIQHGHPVVVIDQNGSTALHHAMIEGHVAAMHVLVQHGHPPFDLEVEEYPLLHN